MVCWIAINAGVVIVMSILISVNLRAAQRAVPRTKELIKFAVNIAEYIINYLQLFLGNKLFCEAVEELQTAVEFHFSKTKLSNTLGFIKYLQVKLVILMVRVNLPRLTVIIKQNKL